MKRKQQTKYCDNFKSRYSQFSQVPNKREMVTSNFGKIYHSFQFITTPHPPSPPKKKIVVSYDNTIPDKTVRMVFWGFQGVENWNIGTKWVKWMDQGIAHFNLLWPPLDLWFQIKIPIPLLDSYLLFSPTIRNLRGKRRTTFKSFHSIINCINQIVMLILNPNDIYRFFLHSLTHLLMSVLSLMTSKNPWMHLFSIFLVRLSAFLK